MFKKRDPVGQRLDAVFLDCVQTGRYSRTAFPLIFVFRRDGERLTEVFLVQPDEGVALPSSVISFYE